MNYEEVKAIVKSKHHMLLHTYSGTVNRVLMDLYIAYQDDIEEAAEKRALIRQEIKNIVDS